MTDEQCSAWIKLAVAYQKDDDDRLTPGQYLWQILWRMAGDHKLWRKVQFTPRRRVIADILAFEDYEPCKEPSQSQRSSLIG